MAEFFLIDKFLSNIILEGLVCKRPLILHVNLGLSSLIVFELVKIQSCWDLNKCTLPLE